MASLAGRPRVARAGLSVLSNVGLGEWCNELHPTVTRSPEDYVKRAIGLAGDLPRLGSRTHSSVFFPGGRAEV